DDGAMLDVELGRPAFGAQVIRVLRLAGYADVNSRAYTAGREMVGRERQRFAKRVTPQERQSSRETILDSNLQRIVVRQDAVFQELNVAELRERAQAGRSRAVRVNHYGALVGVAEAGELRAFVADVSDFEQ